MSDFAKCPRLNCGLEHNPFSLCPDLGQKYDELTKEVVNTLKLAVNTPIVNNPANSPLAKKAQRQEYMKLYMAKKRAQQYTKLDCVATTGGKVSFHTVSQN